MCEAYTVLYILYILRTFTIISQSALPKIRNISDKIFFRNSKQTFYVQ